MSTDPLWYLDPAVQSTVNKYIFQDRPEDLDWKQGREEFIHLVVTGLREGSIILEDRPEGFNDDDRWGGKWNDKGSGGKAPDTVVIHHTATSPDIDIWSLEALGLLRLYYPLYAAGSYKEDRGDVPISSGHYRDSIQTFLGYHYLIYPDGTIFQALDPLNYTGFHAGNYGVNCRSVGIAIIGDLTEGYPSGPAQHAIQDLLDSHRPKTVIGHQEVPNLRQPTICPGNDWKDWKQDLVLS